MNTTPPEFLSLTSSNLEREHICCAISGKQHEEGVAKKKAFLSRGFGQGLEFCKLDVRGKVFIEYAPAEAAWRPVIAPGCLVIHCLWVSGRYKGNGFGRTLLEKCLSEGQRYRGVVAVSGRTPYLTDTSFYLHQGFELLEQTQSGFDLVYHPADVRSERTTKSSLPRFGENARRGTVPEDGGVHFEYAHQCPFVPGCLRGMSDVARGLGLEVTLREFTTAGQAQTAASPFGTFGAFFQGRLLTHELMSDRKFAQLLTRALAK